MTLCAICNRKARGFGWFNPLLKVTDPRRDKSRRKFCSCQCQDRWAAFIKQEGYMMIDPTKQEKEAMDSVRKPLYELISAEIGLHKSIQDYSLEDMTKVIDVIITNYQDYLFNNFPDDQPPKPKGKN